LHQDYHAATSETLAAADEIIQNFKLAPRDALHAASAALGNAQYFLSCDDGISRRFKTKALSVNIGTEARMLEVMNPIVFVTKMGR
jgi:predicted nucleic acid-binding protein